MMTDLELVKACAEAMGWEIDEENTVYFGEVWVKRYTGPEGIYNPLEDDCQMAQLVKRFRLEITPYDELWNVGGGEGSGAAAQREDLNRAVCECVAKIHAAR